MIKALKKLGIKGTFLNIIKAIFEKPIVKILVNGEKLKPFLAIPGTRQGCPFSPLLSNIVLEFFARTMRKSKKKYKGFK
jgi:hypothetical protein